MFQKIWQKIYGIISAKWFFYVVLGIFIVQAAWFALTVQYPIAFDESYHVGIIQFYAHQWLPFFSSQPPDSQAYGDLTRYSSYLFHYLMSFPYRLVDLVPNAWAFKIIMLRFIDIGLFVGGIVLFRRLFEKLHLSTGLTNFSLLMFVLVPLTPFLAATVNYDNLAFLALALFLNLTVTVSRTLKEKATLPAAATICLLSVGMLGSLVKYAFLPIFAAGVLYVLGVWLRQPHKQKIIRSFWTTYKKTARQIQIFLAILLALSMGLFAERYGINLVEYHRYEPQCQTIRPVSECVQYGPWARSYYRDLELERHNEPLTPAPQYFLPAWVGTMMYRMYFAINYDFSEHDPLPLPYYTAWIVGLSSLVLCLIFWRSILAIDRHMLLLAAVIVFYVAALLYTNIGGYLRFKTINYAVNGRYLIIVLPLIFAWLGLAMQQFAHRVLRTRARATLVSLSVVVLLLTLNGGGAETYLLRSQPIWFWQYSPAPAVNSTLQKALSPFIVDGQPR